MPQEKYIPDFKKELKELAKAQGDKVETQKSDFDRLKEAEQRVRKEADDILRIAKENSDNPEKFILEGIKEYAKAEKIPLIAAKARVLQYLSPEWKEKVDAEVVEYFKKFDLDAFTKLKAGTPESVEVIETLKILRDEGYMPYFVIAVHYQDDFAKKKVALEKYEAFTKTIKTILKDAESKPFNAKEEFVLNPQKTLPEARKFIEGLKNVQRDKYEYVINLAYRYLVIGRAINKEFSDFDCDEVTLLLQKTALDESIEMGNYMAVLKHVVLKLDGFPLVLDTFDTKIRSVEECARSEGYGEKDSGSYFWRDNKGQYLAQHEKGNYSPKKIIGYKKVENNPYLVSQYEDMAGLLIGRTKLLKSEGKNNEAKSYYEKALQIDPNNAIAHCLLATLLVFEKKNDEAKSHYEMALQINPNFANAHCLFAILLMFERKNDEARSHCETALQINPNDPDFHTVLALIKKLKDEGY